MTGPRLCMNSGNVLQSESFLYASEIITSEDGKPFLIPPSPISSQYLLFSFIIHFIFIKKNLHFYHRTQFLNSFGPLRNYQMWPPKIISGETCFILHSGVSIHNLFCAASNICRLQRYGVQEEVDPHTKLFISKFHLCDSSTYK